MLQTQPGRQQVLDRVPAACQAGPALQWLSQAGRVLQGQTPADVLCGGIACMSPVLPRRSAGLQLP